MKLYGTLWKNSSDFRGIREGLGSKEWLRKGEDGGMEEVCEEEEWK